MRLPALLRHTMRTAGRWPPAPQGAPCHHDWLLGKNGARSQLRNQDLLGSKSFASLGLVRTRKASLPDPVIQAVLTERSPHRGLGPGPGRLRGLRRAARAHWDGMSEWWHLNELKHLRLYTKHQDESGFWRPVHTLKARGSNHARLRHSQRIPRPLTLQANRPHSTVRRWGGWSWVPATGCRLWKAPQAPSRSQGLRLAGRARCCSTGREHAHESQASGRPPESIRKETGAVQRTQSLEQPL